MTWDVFILWNHHDVKWILFLVLRENKNHKYFLKLNQVVFVPKLNQGAVSCCQVLSTCAKGCIAGRRCVPRTDAWGDVVCLVSQNRGIWWPGMRTYWKNPPTSSIKARNKTNKNKWNNGLHIHMLHITPLKTATCPFSIFVQNKNRH